LTGAGNDGAMMHRSALRPSDFLGEKSMNRKGSDGSGVIFGDAFL
jgi:hypothetical protein